MDQKQSKQFAYVNYDIAEIQKQFNELYTKILVSQEEMSKTRLFNINPNDYTLWKEDNHKEFYNKFDKILK